MSNELFLLSDVNFKLEDFNDGDLEEVKRNQELILGYAVFNRVDGIVWNNINKIPKRILSKEITKCFERQYEAKLIQTNKFKNNICYLAEVLEDVEFNYALLKGAYLITKVYHDGCRTSNDIDILIDCSELDKCQKRLREFGFIQGRYDDKRKEIVEATRKEIVLSRMNYGETHPFGKIINGEPVFIDINFSVDFKPPENNIVVRRFLDNSEYVEFRGNRFKTLNNVDFIIHLCYHLFKEATTYNWVKEGRDLLLYKFCDINLLLTKQLTKQFADDLAAEIKYISAERECYYTLYNMALIYPSITKNEIFKKLLDEIRPANLSYMKMIVMPSTKKVFEYKENFIQWFYNKDKCGTLEEIINE